MNQNIKIVKVSIDKLRASSYNPRRLTAEQEKHLTESIARFGLVDPIIVNKHPGREFIVIGGHMRLRIAKKLGYKDIPVVFLSLTESKERELNIRLNSNLGEFDFDLLKNFGEEFLADVGFSSEALDQIFEIENTPEEFDLEKELKKLDIKKIEVKKGDVYQLGDSKLKCGDSTIENDVLGLMSDEKADMCFTDPPYILDYLHGKSRNGKPTEGFGLKKNRKYLETDFIPDNFSDLWMANVAKVQKPDFSIIIFEHPKNLRTIWNALEKYWRYRNTITWHVPGFSAKYKFFNKADIALIGSSGNIKLNITPESNELFQNEYENAIYATSGKPHWEGYEKGKKICPTDFIEHIAADEKSSGQGIIFGTKPLELLIPYIKVLTKRNDLIIEPFGGSGSTLIAATKMKRRCYIMEKSPVYAEVIMKRWEKLTGLTRKKS
jgi:DNA modification methylase